jgi:hypothetical protein
MAPWIRARSLEKKNPAGNPRYKQTPAPNTTGGLGIDVDKPSYVVYETAVFSGSIDKAEEGKTVRIDVYDPRGGVFQDNLSTKTDIDGAYSYPVTLQNYFDTTMTGQYTAIATYNKQSAATKFNLWQAASWRRW